MKIITNIFNLLLGDWWLVQGAYNYTLYRSSGREKEWVGDGKHKNEHSEHTTHRLSTDQGPKEKKRKNWYYYIIMIKALAKQ